MTLAIGFWLLAGAAACAALYILKQARQRAIEDVVTQRVQSVLQTELFPRQRGAPSQEASRFPGRVLTRLRHVFERAGLPVSDGKLMLIAGGLAGLGLLVGQRLGFEAGGIAAAAAAFGIYVYLYQRWRRRIQRMRAQMPMFLDHLIRALDIGRNLYGGIQTASEEIDEPLREVMLRVRARIDLGEDLADTVTEAARLYELKELHLFAMAVRVNRQFGGQVRDTLQSIVRMIEQRDRAQRELKALTGETRITAMVLGGLPTLLALYMSATNPDYLASMWYDPGGRYVLIGAGLWQLLGVGLLWRMMRRL